MNACSGRSKTSYISKLGAIPTLAFRLADTHRVPAMTDSQIPTMANEPPTPASANLPSPATRRKLKGRAFYESLGSPKMILAPMVDQSEFVRCCVGLF